MDASERILSFASGSLEAQLMFIGEAPGRLGADATGIPFHGDKAGDNFEELLQAAGISREDLFVTNAVLCNPKDDSGNNATPHKGEIGNCSAFLKRQIDLVNPAIVVTLGANALMALSLIAPHNLTLNQSVRQQFPWYGRKLIPLYHPGQRAMIHRSKANQRSDYQFVAEQLKRLGIKRKPVRGKTSGRVAEVARTILQTTGRISYFALHKLAYLLELQYAEQHGGKRLTGAYFIRQKDGPYCTDLHLSKLKNAMPGLSLGKDAAGITLGLPPTGLFHDEQTPAALSKAELRFIVDALHEFAGASNERLKTRVYLTRPMKKILRLERDKSLNMHNAPISFD